MSSVQTSVSDSHVPQEADLHGCVGSWRSGRVLCGEVLTRKSVHGGSGAEAAAGDWGVDEAEAEARVHGADTSGPTRMCSCLQEQNC